MTAEPRTKHDYGERETEAAYRVLIDLGQVLAFYDAATSEERDLHARRAYELVACPEQRAERVRMLLEARGLKPRSRS